MADLEPGWWPVDKLITAYIGATSVLIIAFFRVVPGAAMLLSLHIAGVLLLALAVKKPGRASWVFRHWYPLPYVAACYKEMAILIPPIRATDLDTELAWLDYRIWGAHPTVWLERISSAPLTEVLQVLYSLFVPAVLLVAFVLWKQRRFVEFRYYAFLIALGFLASYAGYFMVPVRGPRFLLQHLQTAPLHGLWLFDLLRGTLDRLESAHYDCFPSGHTELTVLAWWGSRKISMRAPFWAYTLSIIFATVYLRYHYTVDVLAGVVLALFLILTAPHLYRTLGERDR